MLSPCRQILKDLKKKDMKTTTKFQEGDHILFESQNSLENSDEIHRIWST